MPPEPWIRPAAVAGRFYSDDPAVLDRMVEDFLAQQGGQRLPRSVTAVVAPHAGYVYSGRIAGSVFAAVEVPERVVVLGPNHTGMGKSVAVIGRGAFRLPGGDVEIDPDLADAIFDEVPGATWDRDAHRHEHAIEVELPFLRAKRRDVRFVPITLGWLDEDKAIAVGQGLARAIARMDGPVLVVASTDLSHYLPDEHARLVDRVAIDAMLALDAGHLFRTVREHDISMCGVIPTTATFACAGQAGAGTPELVGYATSADASGDTSRVVGYAGLLIP